MAAFGGILAPRPIQIIQRSAVDKDGVAGYSIVSPTTVPSASSTSSTSAGQVNAEATLQVPPKPSLPTRTPRLSRGGGHSSRSSRWGGSVATSLSSFDYFNGLSSSSMASTPLGSQASLCSIEESKEETSRKAEPWWRDRLMQVEEAQTPPEVEDLRRHDGDDKSQNNSNSNNNNSNNSNNSNSNNNNDDNRLS
eukprot:TRINITY_DN16528_c0_g5_i1.p1 TRINITY_DN16528_c0_g5~~TRINITY_DN16528_c0_g5_i1.p1  ORF type:complete len:203 (+),score=45.92 TRINITY_DN16528_c0_g5_i1:29-610(+)